MKEPERALETFSSELKRRGVAHRRHDFEGKPGFIMIHLDEEQRNAQLVGIKSAAYEAVKKHALAANFRKAREGLRPATIVFFSKKKIGYQ